MSLHVPSDLRGSTTLVSTTSEIFKTTTTTMMRKPALLFVPRAVVVIPMLSLAEDHEGLMKRGRPPMLKITSTQDVVGARRWQM